MNPFDIVNDINFDKKGIITEDNQKEYKPWLINKALSYFPETLLYAQEMNVRSNLDNKLQYDYLLRSIRKGKRFSKWAKKDKDDDIEAVREFFSYSRDKAKSALAILSEDQLKRIKRELQVSKEF